jgi:hypothetical protein
MADVWNDIDFVYSYIEPGQRKRSIFDDERRRRQSVQDMTENTAAELVVPW